MESTVQTTTTQHMGDISRRAQEGTRGFKVAAKEPHGHQARRDDFRIAHLVLHIFGMADGIQDVGTQTIHGYNLVIHGSLVFLGEVGRLPSPWGKRPMDVNMSQLVLN